MAIAVSDLGTVEDAGSDAQSNFSFGSFGAEATDRYLVALISCQDSDSTVVNSVTIGGVSATISVQAPSASRNTQTAIAIAAVPTGSSGSVVVNWSQDIGSDQLCTLLRVTGLSSVTAYDTDGVEDRSNDPSLAGSIDCEAGGVVIAGAVNTNGRTSTWSLANEVVDQPTTDGNIDHSVAYEMFATAQTGLSVTNSLSGNSANKKLAIAAFSGVSSIPATANPTGVAGAGAAGTTTATGKANKALTGVSGTGQAGTPTVSGKATISIAGVSATGAAGTVSAGVSATVAVTGVQASGAAGTITATGIANIALVGVEGSGEAGTAAASGAALANLTGVSGTGAAGDAAAAGAAVIALPGVGATGAAGNVTAGVAAGRRRGGWGQTYVPPEVAIERRQPREKAAKELDSAVRYAMGLAPEVIVTPGGQVIPLSPYEWDDEVVLLLVS